MKELSAKIAACFYYPLAIYLCFGGYVITLTSDHYSAKQAVAAYVVPPYAWYIAATYPWSLLDSEADEDQLDQAWEHLRRTVQHWNAASELQESYGFVWNEEEQEAVRVHWRRALDAARQIDTRLIDRSSPGLGDAIEHYLLPGLERMISAKDNQEMLEGQGLHRHFVGEFERLQSEGQVTN